MNIDIESKKINDYHNSTRISIQPRTILEYHKLINQIDLGIDYKTDFEKFIESAGLDCMNVWLNVDVIDNKVFFIIELIGAEELIKGKEKLIIEYIKERV